MTRTTGEPPGGPARGRKPANTWQKITGRASPQGHTPHFNAQAIAICPESKFRYETKGDSRYALSFYEKGIDEYSRMLKAGSLKERAKDGLRVCENGKKICSVE